jgi:hypothetical protein
MAHTGNSHQKGFLLFWKDCLELERKQSHLEKRWKEDFLCLAVTFIAQRSIAWQLRRCKEYLGIKPKVHYTSWSSRERLILSEQCFMTSACWGWERGYDGPGPPLSYRRYFRQSQVAEYRIMTCGMWLPPPPSPPPPNTRFLCVNSQHFLSWAPFFPPRTRPRTLVTPGWEGTWYVSLQYLLCHTSCFYAKTPANSIPAYVYNEERNKRESQFICPSAVVQILITFPQKLGCAAGTEMRENPPSHPRWWMLGLQERDRMTTQIPEAGVWRYDRRYFDRGGWNVEIWKGTFWQIQRSTKPWHGAPGKKKVELRPWWSRLLSTMSKK